MLSQLAFIYIAVINIIQTFFSSKIKKLKYLFKKLKFKACKNNIIQNTAKAAINQMTNVVF